ncbi:PKD domain-containing protein [Candidatus Woesearchaeota archaeon]|nr:PKD domain-containing protein [Candidatus Woesearchaeota archaeon]
MKKLILFLVLFVALLSINISAFPELEDARWAKNYESSVTIRNGETASLFYTISSSNAPVLVSIYLTDNRDHPLSHILTQEITEEDFNKQGYIYSNGELKLGYTSGLINIEPNNYDLKEGNYNIQIEIKDEKNNERNSILALELVVAESTGNKLPTAVISVFPSKTVVIGTPVTVSGLDSYDEDGSVEEYEWLQFSGNEEFSFDPKAPAIIVTPTKEGYFSFILKVIDNEGLKSSISLEEVKVVKEVVEENEAPIANAGQDQKVEANSLVTLDGSLSSDPEGDQITYLWKQVNGEGVVLSGITTQNPQFLASEVGVYNFELTVADSRGASSTDQVTITVVSASNINPVALFNIPSEAKVNEPVTFDASPSYDQDGSIVEYKWETDGNTLFDKIASYVYTTTKEFIVKLTVKDNKGAVSTLEKTISIREEINPEENKAPIANAGNDQTVKINNIVTLDGSLSYDPDGDGISYSWIQTEGPLVNLLGSATKNPRFTAETMGRYKFSLTVIDDKGKESLPDEVITLVLEDGQVPPQEEVSREIHKFTITSAFAQEKDNRLDVYAKIKNRGNNRENIIMTVTVLPTGEYSSARTVAGIKENSYEVVSVNKPQESGDYIIKIDVSNRRDRDVYYLPVEI